MSAFELAAELEQAGDLEAATVSYQTLMAKDARAAVNLGCIHFNHKQYGLAADALRHAVKIAPDYALAWFNLGNTLIELVRAKEAVTAYETAIKLSPRYADAHYNLALRLPARKAIKHWRCYVKLEPVGKWADRARREIAKTLKADKLAIVWRRA